MAANKDRNRRWPSTFSSYGHAGNRQLKIESYPQLYENEAAIGLMVFRAFMRQEEIVELSSKITEQSPEERGQTLREMVDALAEFDQAFELPKPPADERKAQAQFDAFSKNEQAEAIKIAQHRWMGFLAGFFQSLSMMVHGEKLTSLVPRPRPGTKKPSASRSSIELR